MLPFDPRKPLFGFKARAPHAWRRILLYFADDPFIYLRPKHAPEDWLGAVFYFGQLGAGFERHVIYDVNEGHFWRVFHLPDPRLGEERIWRVAWRPDYGYVIPVGHAEELSGAFFWPQKIGLKVNLWRTPTSVLQEHFRREWNDPTSDVREALAWCDIERSERNWRSIKWISGGQEELQAIMRAAIRCESEWPRQTTLEVRIHMSSQRVHAPDEFGAWGRFILMKWWDFSENYRLTRLFARLRQRNYGVMNSPNGDRLQWRFSWDGPEIYFPTRRNGRIRFLIEPPTQHERLEAALFLRDWLRQNAPDLLPDWFPGEVVG